MTPLRWRPYRRMAQWRAKVLGYFWAPCPLCGTMFGGQEWRDYGGHESTIPVDGSWSHGEGICPWCTVAGKGDAAYAALRNTP